MGEQVVKQLLQHPRTLTIAGAVLGVLGLLPGMPNGIFLALALITGGGGYWLEKRARAVRGARSRSRSPSPLRRPPSASSVGRTSRPWT